MYKHINISFKLEVAQCIIQSAGLCKSRVVSSLELSIDRTLIGNESEILRDLLVLSGRPTEAEVDALLWLPITCQSAR